MSNEPSYYWIVDPVGHRAQWRAGLPEDGSTVDTPFGPAENIILPPPPDDEWVCDFCNEEIPLTGTDPDGNAIGVWVPSIGSYALCPRCYQDNGGAALWVDDGMYICGCPACVSWWEKYQEEVMNG